jgi:maltose O-acetyltransferase
MRLSGARWGCMRVSLRKKILSGELFVANDPELIDERRRAKGLCRKDNQSFPDLDKLTLSELLGYQTDAYLEPPLFCDCGFNIQLGRNVYANLI